MQHIQTPSPNLLLAGDRSRSANRTERRTELPTQRRTVPARRWSSLLRRIATLRRRLASGGRRDPMATPSSQALDSTGLRDRHR